MHPDIQRLIELQAIDLHLAQLRGRLNSLPRQLADIDAKVGAARQQVASAKEALTGSLKDRKRYEMDVDSWKEKARKYRDQISAVKTNEAYKALQHEVEHAQKEMAQAEDRLLERMVAGEEYERQVKAAELALVSDDRAAESERQKLKAEQNVLQQEVGAAEAEREKIVPQIEENLLGNYEAIARRRHGVALSEARDGSCAMCGMMVRPHVVQELRRVDSHEIFQCETCTRMLYYVERAPAATAVSAGSPRDVTPDQGDPPGGEG